MRERPSRPTAIATVIVLALTAAACSTSGAGEGRSSSTSPARPSATAVEPTGGAFPDDWPVPALDWSSCDLGRDTECATLTVPLDWAEPTGPTVDLALGRIAASGPADQRVGSLLLNPGGPGGSGLEMLTDDPMDAAVGRRFDLVSWDPRGVGDSTAVRCGESEAQRFLALDPTPDDAEEQAELDRGAQAVSAACAASPEAALLPHVGTDQVVLDLEAIRRALDDGALNFVGFSYGTQIGQRYAEEFPTEVRAMVLDGVVDPALGFTDFLLGQVRGFDAAFDENVARCAEAGERECGVDDLATAYDEVSERVERSPLRAQGGRRVGPAELAVAATYVAYLSDGWLDLGPALARALDGDGDDLWELASSYYDLGGYSAYASVVCHDTPPPSDPAAWRAFADEAREVSPRFGGSVANELLPCATWPVRSTEVPTGATAAGAPPILVVGNTGDPATPYEGAVTVAGRLRDGVLVTSHIDGHTAYGVDDCVTDAVDRYLIDLAVPDGDLDCG